MVFPRNIPAVYTLCKCFDQKCHFTGMEVFQITAYVCTRFESES